MLPVAFPHIKLGTSELHDGIAVAACKFCREKFAQRTECSKHYVALEKRQPGFYQCPFGFTTQLFRFRGETFAQTGVIAHPRFGTAQERQRAKDFPGTRVSRDQMLSNTRLFEEIERLALQVVEESRKSLPQALHELRKLNATVKQGSEAMEAKYPNESLAKTVHSASELMTNNFDVLEALINLDGLKALPMDDVITIRDLAYKTKKIHQFKAKDRAITINVTGVDARVRGSRKSLPLLLSILVENAIKYSRTGTNVEVKVEDEDGTCRVLVSNTTDFAIDPMSCFGKGVRFATSIEGSGLGLYLAKELADAHKAAISCSKFADRVVMRLQMPSVQIPKR